MLRLERLLNRKFTDHRPYEFHRVDFYLLILVESGNGLHTVDFHDFTCQAGSVLTIRKDQIMKYFTDTDLKGSILLFEEEFLISYLSETEALRSMQLFNDFLAAPLIQLTAEEQGEIFDVVGRMQKEYLTINDSFSQEIIRSELQILISKLSRIKTKPMQESLSPKYLSQFIQFQGLVEEKCRESRQVNYFARLMGISAKTLNTIVQSIVHKTAKEFIVEISILQIKRLLINTSLSIKEIAYSSGFEEPTNMFKFFKKATGTTPEQFREQF